MPHTITRHDLTLARRAAKRAAISAGNHHDDELESVAMSALVEASRRFNGNGTFAGFAAMRIRSRLIDAIRKIATEREVYVDGPTLTTIADDRLTITIEVDTTAFDQAMQTLPESVALCFTSGDIDLRRRDHRDALDALRKALP